MKELIQIENNKKDTLRIMYNLSNVCNYKCWYCFPGCNDGTVGWPDLTTAKLNMKHLLEYYFNNGTNDINLNLIGGEPSLWRDLGEFVQYIKDNVNKKWYQKIRISMQTNASRTLRWWEEYGHYFDHVSISVHGERADPLHISKVGQILVDKGVFCFASVLMDHKHWDKSVELVDTILSTKTSFMVQVKPIHVNGIYNYTDSQNSYLSETIKRKPSISQAIKNYKTISSIPTITASYSDGSKIKTKVAYKIVQEGIQSFTGWSCSIGQTWIYINLEGNITGTCGNKLYGVDYFYNINDKDFVNKFAPKLTSVICEKGNCSCEGEIVLAKKKI